MENKEKPCKFPFGIKEEDQERAKSFLQDSREHSIDPLNYASSPAKKRELLLRYFPEYFGETSSDQLINCDDIAEIYKEIYLKIKNSPTTKRNISFLPNESSLDKIVQIESIKEEFSIPSVFERQTNLKNLAILSTESLADPQSALEIFRKVKKLKNNIGVMSFELDKNLQPYLDYLFHERKKANYSEFPGLGYTIDYCIFNRIPIFAKDKSQQKYLREIANINLELQKRASKAHRGNLYDIHKEWEDSLNMQERLRAEDTSKELQELSKKVKEKIYHVSSERQAKIIFEII